MPDQDAPADDLRSFNERTFSELKTELFKRQVSNAENFDKAILTFSSGALALSLGFLKDFVSLDTASLPYVLYASWFLFVFCIIITVASFLVSQIGIQKQLKLAKRYYLDSDESALQEKNGPLKLSNGLNWFSGALFGLAVFSTAVFVATNAEEASMTSSRNNPSDEVISKIISGETRIIKGITAAEITPRPASSKPVPTPETTPSEEPGAQDTTGKPR
ncbi:hypothetical protein LU699_08730 [Luteimonas fraxinea]|uniref:Uncharacterized protein n=1 Tax=Luteimonas fraxinea TaxID=2901869 RepID=A0ABS8UFI1_9GAMM|nr:hypothetical protein [Luteimonas fraxinea]MCD9097516.1 hypothetical protein [Luteimonas fraxinea]UHH11766.1 hypothetical protein LU699_08730 [Luteimonas fraxinea]